MSKKQASTRERGYQGAHPIVRRRLLAALVPGAACFWCGQPMFQEAERNWDQRPLAADHDGVRARDHGLAGRLLHFTCNSQRQDGEFDDVRPAVIGCTVSEWRHHRNLAPRHDDVPAVDFVW